MAQQGHAASRTPGATSEKDQSPAEWPGFDGSYQKRVIEAAHSAFGERFRKGLAGDLARIRGRISPLGLPVLVRSDDEAILRQFGSAYHRCIEAVARAWGENEEVRQVVTLPPGVREIVAADRELRPTRIHLCRLDLLLEPLGGFSVVETNANCPGGLMSAGWASREWRSYLSKSGVETTAPLDHETRRWMASWFIQTAEEETGEALDFVVLLRWEGGNRLELPGLATELRELGVEAKEADPRDLVRARDGSVSLDGRTVRYAYWKLGMRELCEAGREMRKVLTAIRLRKLFVQNGISGRFVGDNKLCLAVLSDPSFDPLFDVEDIALIRRHLPWSRNAARCGSPELETVLSTPADYVLKRPLDTRGSGVVIGREISSPEAWEHAVAHAVRGHWLVQRFCETTRLATRLSSLRCRPRQDLSLGLANGRLVGAMSRSSPELRTNVALRGCLHPVFMES